MRRWDTRKGTTLVSRAIDPLTHSFIHLLSNDQFLVTSLKGSFSLFSADLVVQKNFAVPGAELARVAVSRRNDVGVLVTNSKQLRLLKLPQVELGEVLEENVGPVHHLAVSPDGRRVSIIISNDCTVRTYDLEKRRFLPSPSNQRLWAHASYLDEDRLLVHQIESKAGAPHNSRLLIWGLREGKATHTRSFESFASHPAHADDGKFALATSVGDLHVLELPSLRTLRTVACGQGSINTVVLSRDGRRAATISPDKSIRIWDVDWLVRTDPQ
jgi:WD40 repeat protein